MPYLSALEVCSRLGAIQIHVYLYRLPSIALLRECGYRESPSTHVTDAVAEKVDHSDPVFPPDVQLENRARQPQLFAIEDMYVLPINDNDDGGVDA